ncbi:MAG: A24 family peptidase [Actinomycetota bacterium]|nr:A24 family peptidase [Actinomycetota bacterium]
MTAADLAIATAAAAAAGALAWFSPRLVAALPEPEDAAEGKPLYADLAVRRALAPRLAVAAALAAGAVGVVLADRAVLLAWVYVCAIGVVLAFIDWHTALLPFRIVAPSYAVVAALVLLAAGLERDLDLLVRAGIGWVASFSIFFLMWLVYRRGLGYGDVRLSGVLGMALAAVGWQELVIGMYAGFLFGALGGGILALLRKVDRKAYPFGPFMVLGACFGVVSEPLFALWTG